MQKFPTKELRPKERDLLRLKNDALNKLLAQRRVYADDFTGPRGDVFQYEKSLRDTLLNGNPKFDRTGTDTVGIHGYQSRFNLDNGFPLITTKKVHLKSVIHELLWLIRGDTNIKYLVENGVSIWSDWPLKHYNESHTEKTSLNVFHELILGYDSFAKKWGELGPVYGKQWRAWEKSDPWDHDGAFMHRTVEIDQIQQVVDMINKQHETGVISRRMIVSAWNVADIPAMIKSGLPPCHCLFQFHSRIMTLAERQKHWARVNEKDFSFTQNMDDDTLDEVNAPVYELDLQLYQRSCDIFLGVPFNIASYAMLLMMVAQVTNTKPGTFIHDYGDLHIYSNHLDQVVEQLMRTPVEYPTMKLKNRGQKIDEFLFDDFVLENYNPHKSIKASVAV